ncbi:MAG: hypothetical protein AAF598_06730 [Bacteroidota bacterium]
MENLNNAALGSILLDVKENPKNRLSPPLEKALDELVEAIKSELSKNKLKQVAERLRPAFFNLRIQLVQWLIKNEFSITEFMSKKIDRVDALLEIGSFSDLAFTYSRVLNYHPTFNQGIVESLPLNKIEDSIKEEETIEINYQTFKTSLSTVYPIGTYILNWMDHSLNLDLFMIVAELFFSEQFSINQEQQEELIELFNENLTQYGAYAHLLRIWQPDESAKEDPVLNRMMIVSAIMEMDYSPSEKMSLDQVKSLILG